MVFIVNNNIHLCIIYFIYARYGDSVTAKQHKVGGVFNITAKNIGSATHYSNFVFNYDNTARFTEYNFSNIAVFGASTFGYIFNFSFP